MCCNASTAAPFNGLTWIGDPPSPPFHSVICPGCGQYIEGGHACLGRTVWNIPTCDHCYCQEHKLISTLESHKRCCKCGDARAEKYIGKDGR